MRYYSISEDDLRRLIGSDLKLSALESGGVDNWSWYGESLNDFLKEYASDEGFECEYDEGEFDFDEAAQFELERDYQALSFD